MSVGRIFENFDSTEYAIVARVEYHIAVAEAFDGEAKLRRGGADLVERQFTENAEFVAECCVDFFTLIDHGFIASPIRYKT